MDKPKYTETGCKASGCETEAVALTLMGDGVETDTLLTWCGAGHITLAEYPKGQSAQYHDLYDIFEAHHASPG